MEKSPVFDYQRTYIRCYIFILEITKANDISFDKAVLKFLKDIEEQYDDKLGFEMKVDEKRKELSILNNLISNGRCTLQAIPFTGPSLFNLFQKGVSEQDIININQLIETCTNNIDLDIQNEKEKNNVSRTERWKMLINDLQNYGNIKLAVKEKQDNLDRLQRKVNDLANQKQEIKKYLQNIILFMNLINNKILYYKGLMDNFNQINNNKTNLLSRSHNHQYL